MLEISHISKTFKRGSEEFAAVVDATFNIEKGDYVSVSGPSGSGKSTLLNMIGGLVRPDTGEIIFRGENIYDRGGKYLELYRKREVGFIFQQFHLMPYLTVTENIMLSCFLRSHVEAIQGYLDQCSLRDLKDKYPSDLSVGEKQRVAFVRAIISNPIILLADEPTGNLDPRNSEILMALIGKFHKGGGTVVLVSHDPVASNYSTMKIRLMNGKPILT